MKTHLLAYLSILDIELRLNVWPSGAEGPDDGPHTHSTWYLAVPLWGTLVEKLFRQKPEEHVPHFVHARFRWPLRPYFCSRSVVHSLLPIDSNSAASLVLSGRPR